MAIFKKGKLTVITERENADFSSASLNKNLSAVGYDKNEKFFYMTMDRAMFSDPVSTIRTVLDAHGFVPNLENILSCLDSFNFSAHSRISARGNELSLPEKVIEYLPCIRFELPHKNKVGGVLQSFYDEISKYESKSPGSENTNWATDSDIKKFRDQLAEVKKLKAENQVLAEQVSALTHQLSIEQKSLNRASKALDSQRVLPDNAKICRVENIDLKQRKVKVKCDRKLIDIPTHMLDRVPDYQARCLITFGEDEEVPQGIIFFNNEELCDLEKRTAELLYVKGDTFKARDSMRNEFQIKAVNVMEEKTIESLTRGMKVVISISDGYVVRFSVLGSTVSEQFTSYVQEQFIVYDIARNQLVIKSNDNDQE
ncbi:hypothetical protein MNBD_GAMMA09-3368 [hydrothermal vent metagenome]|uniref:Uncharacterized protein n=1 Tax=hydrothermal vent metagenome TaxID=652676 RepID=A0A3B0XZL8_9ZZZZ